LRGFIHGTDALMVDANGIGAIVRDKLERWERLKPGTHPSEVLPWFKARRGFRPTIPR
jgi:hypothetical protein